MANHYTALFSTGRIGKMALKNRIMMASMATNFAMADGEVSQRLIDYYVERARGGAGLITIENANVDYPMGRNGAIQLRIDDDMFIKGLSTLCEAIHDVDSKVRVALQISHGGASTKASRTGRQIVGPSPMPVKPNGETPQALTVEGIKAITEKFGQAAFRAKQAGFDAVEIHGANAYLLATFISPYTNKRTDDYGGSMANRMRFPLEVVASVRKMVGPDFPILFRMSGDEFIDGGLTLADAKQHAGLLEAAGVDMLHITAGNGFTHERHVEPASYPEAWKAYLAKAIKMAVQIPVAAVGVIRSPETADALIEAGDADFIAIGRGLIADPYWPQKALAGESDSIRRCISCLTCTARRVNDNLPICCAINPEAGHEGEIREIRIGMKFQTPKKITVVGGGPAGMYAAVSLQKLGHDVTLMESRQQLGGQLRLASVPPCKDKINWLVAYLEKSLAAAGVTVQLGVHADVDHIKATGAALVVVATGAKPFVPPIAGADKSLVITAHALLGEQKTYRDLDIVVIGGGSVGCETAEYLAEGNRVTVVEMRDDFAIDLKPYNKSDLVKRLNETTIQILTQTQVASIEDDGVNCQKRHADGSTEMLHLAADKVVMAVGSTPERTLANALEAASIDAICIGDCTAPKQIIDALRQGFVMIKQQSAL